MATTSDGLPTHEYGEELDEVVLKIDYQIIEHFSRNLYGSPNKAIEELVANGFDAFAQDVYVYIPTASGPVDDRVVVWDDGESMDQEAIHRLWDIASSPKEERPNRVNRGPRGERLMIGKFGIGKLASYTVGDVITHLCRRDDEFLMVSVDYSDLKGGNGKKPVSTENPLRTPLVKVDAVEAEKYVEELFQEDCLAKEKVFDKSHWTIAVIDQMKRDDLSTGRLKWVIGNGMPLRPDFQVWVNDEEVKSRLEGEGAVAEWNFGSPDVVEAIKSYWDEASASGHVDGEPSFSEAKGLDPAHPSKEVPYVELPSLGRIWGYSRLYEDSLKATRATEQGRSAGFFVMVRGRLINPTDDKLLLHEPSYRTFYRSQFVIHADGLDQDLLADRERVKQDTPRAQEMRVIQRAVYLVARNKQKRIDEQRVIEESTTGRLPTYSREHFRDPLLALWLKSSDEEKTPLDLSELEVEDKALDPDDGMARFSAKDAAFHINTRHPYYQALENHYGDASDAVDVFREYELVAISECLFEGFLSDIGVDEKAAEEIIRWREGMYRTFAQTNRESLHQLIVDMEEQSERGKRKFESAISDVLRAMGFLAERDGRSGRKDVLVVAPVGKPRYRMAVEGKSSKNKVKNDDAEIDIANSHRKKAKADHAVVVAREFAGFERPGEEGPMILDQCEGQDGGKVSIMETEALGRLARAVRKYSYPLEALRDVFFAIESPEEKLDRIRELERPPTADFNYGQFLSRVWEMQAGPGEGRFVPYMSIYLNDDDWKKLSEDSFKRKVEALAAMAYPLIYVEDTERITLKQRPDIIVEYIERKLEEAKDATGEHLAT